MGVLAGIIFIVLIAYSNNSENNDVFIFTVGLVVIVALAYADGQMNGAENQMLLINPIVCLFGGVIGFYGVFLTNSGLFGFIIGVVASIFMFIANYKIYKYRINKG